MPERAIRFGVAGRDGRRAETWKCWTQAGTGRSDVYLACRALGGDVKLSLHESGRWHVGFDARRFPAMFEENSAPEDRFSGKWDVPTPLAPGLTLACRVRTPANAVTIEAATLDAEIHWIPVPPQDQMVEVVIFLLAAGMDMVGWPGRDSMGTELVGTFGLDDGGSVWIVHYSLPLVVPVLPPAAEPRYFRGRTESEMLGSGLRAVLWGGASDGSVVFLETPVQVTKNAAG